MNSLTDALLGGNGGCSKLLPEPPQGSVQDTTPKFCLKSAYIMNILRHNTHVAQLILSVSNVTNENDLNRKLLDTVMNRPVGLVDEAAK